MMLKHFTRIDDEETHKEISQHSNKEVSRYDFCNICNEWKVRLMKLKK